MAFLVKVNPDRRRVWGGLFAALVLGLASVLSTGVAPAAASPASYIVVLRDGLDAQAVADEHARTHGLSVAFVYRHALAGYAARLPATRLAQLQADPRVRFVSEDRPLGLAGKPGPGSVVCGRLQKSRGVAARPPRESPPTAPSRCRRWKGSGGGGR